MRLLNTRTLRLESFEHSRGPRYAILSHTWGEAEVTYQDLAQQTQKPLEHEGHAWDKIQRSCEVATAHGYEYIWIDSCCIDKSSSAELSEAINSMFRWYAKAEVCFAYLEDIKVPEGGWDSSRLGEVTEAFRVCRWFTRGWTLQELVAPPRIEFYGKGWTWFGTRRTLKRPIYEVSGIPEDILGFQSTCSTEHDLLVEEILDSVAVAQKMSWAAKRVTSRPEDLAYSLMGLFGINMPLLYGEGGTRAFRRLQEEIIRSTVDESIYCWVAPPSNPTKPYHGLLASHPSAFSHKFCRNVWRPRFMSRTSRNVTTITGDGLQLELLRTPNPFFPTLDCFYIVLACDIIDKEHPEVDHSSPVLIVQRTSSWDQSEFVRIRPELPIKACKNKIKWPPGFTRPSNFSSSLEEPELRQLYIPHGQPYIQQARGFLNEQLQSLEGLGRVMPLFGVWKQRDAWNEDELRFEESPEYEDTWSRTVVLGALMLTSDRANGDQMSSPCIAVGMSPLPNNRLGTKPFYREAWAAFETLENLQKKDFSSLHTRFGRARNNRLAHPLKVTMELDSRFSRLYYRLCISTGTSEAGVKLSKMWLQEGEAARRRRSRSWLPKAES